MTYEVVDNFLPQDEFDKLSTFLMGVNFPIFYSPHVAYTGVDEKNTHYNYYFNHNFLLDDRRSDVFAPIWRDHFDSRFPNINIIRMRLNAYPSTEKVYEHMMHTDYDYPHSGALLCLNTCNGYTRIGDDKIESVANRMIHFDPSEYHASSTCSDQPMRWNIIINYTKIATPPMHLICGPK